MYHYQHETKLITQIHLSEEVIISEAVSEKQYVGMPALLRTPPQVLTYG